MLLDVLGERLDQISSDAKSEPPWRDWIYEPLPLTPWQAWTMIGLVFHQERQVLVVEYLRGEKGVLGQLATSSAPKRRGTWKYGFDSEVFMELDYCIHGRNCCATDRETGEIIDVDFYDESAAWIDENSFIKCLKSLKSPQGFDSRLIALHPSFDSLRQSIRELVEIGALEQLGGSNVVRLNFDYEELYLPLAQIGMKWEDERTRQAMAAAVSDWLLLEELVSSNFEEAVTIRKKAAACKAERTTE
jgi:hypothetical protein